MVGVLPISPANTSKVAGAAQNPPSIRFAYVCLHVCCQGRSGVAADILRLRRQVGNPLAALRNLQTLDRIRVNQPGFLAVVERPADGLEGGAGALPAGVCLHPFFYIQAGKITDFAP